MFSLEGTHIFLHALIFYDGFFGTSILTSSCFYVVHDVYWMLLLT